MRRNATVGHFVFRFFSSLYFSSQRNYLIVYLCLKFNNPTPWQGLLLKYDHASYSILKYFCFTLDFWIGEHHISAMTSEQKIILSINSNGLILRFLLKSRWEGKHGLFSSDKYTNTYLILIFYYNYCISIIL